MTGKTDYRALPTSGSCRMNRLGKALRMPGRNALCWCLGGSAPPEISYGLENGGMTLKPIEVDLPMPQDEEELNSMFAELVDELDLDKPHREAMFNLPPEKKWQIYCSKKKDQDDPKSASWPDYYIEQINTMAKVFFTNDDEEVISRAKLVDNFKTALRTQPMSFVVRFIELDGLQCLVTFLSRMDPEAAASPVHTAVIGCIKALMNNSQGRAHVLGHPTCINTIAQSLATDNIKAKLAALEILGAVCLVPGGHRKALQAMLHFQTYAHERTRFQTLLIDLERTSGIYKNEDNLKTAIMSFINAMLKYGPGQNHLEFRLHLRYELLMLGIMPILEKLRQVDNPTLARHIEFFEMVRNEDEKELAKRFDVNHVDSKSASGMFDLLRKKAHYTAAYPHLLSILFHLLQLPFSNNNAPAQQWMLIDKIIQQVVLQNKEGDPDVAPLELDVKKIVKQLANENEMKNIMTQMREIQKENDELASKLAKRERECEAKAEEKEELISTINNMSSKLEKETLCHLEAKAKIEQLQLQLEELSSLVDLERAERLKLEHAVNTGSLPDDAKVGLSNAALFAAASSKFNRPAPPPGPAPPPPPLPPGMGAPPPPPPPGGGPPPPGGGGGMLCNLPGFAIKKKAIPKPSHPLKSFNWAKLPDNKLTGTIWKDIDEMRLYQALDLADFETNFSAYQQGSDSELFSKAVKVKELSVIDGRRAQNCTILLSKLKMTNSELASAVLHMDPQEDLPKDMCEQLLKFVPSAEETQMLGEHEHEIEQMAKADRFLYEMSKIEHYEQRLKALFYKKKFSERMAECKPKVENVLNASKEVPRSRRLKKVMELVLAFGNYMNRGNRGNASGYRVSSLNKIIDTKSSIDKKKTLMHYLLETIEKRFPDLLRLDEDLAHVKEAAKVNMVELDAEINVLRMGLKDIEKELDYYKKKGVSYDKFVSVMKDFITVASYNFRELEDLVSDMKQRFEKLAKLLAEDPKKAQPNEVLGEFDRFLLAYHDAHQDNQKYRRQKEEEEKRAQMEAQLQKERRGSRNSLGRGKNGRSDSINEEKGEFDDLISALRTGDVFSEDMAKLKRTRRRPSQPKVETVRRPSVPKITEVVRERTGKF